MATDQMLEWKDGFAYHASFYPGRHEKNQASTSKKRILGFGLQLCNL